MNNHEPQKRATKIIEDLIAFLDGEWEERENEIKSLPLSKITAKLSHEGINASSFVSMMKHKISKIEAKEQLDKAHDRYIKLDNLIRNNISSMTDFSNKTDFVQHLKELVGLSQEEALAYYRKFTKNNTTDIKTLLDDISFLDKLGSDNET